MNDVAKTSKKQGQRCGGFQPGKSGNPAGRKQGSRNKITIAMESLLDGQAEQLTRKAVTMALDGDQVALRLCLARIIPPRKDRPISFNLPPLEGPDGIVATQAAIIRAVAEGELTPLEAQTAGGLVEGLRRAYELTDLVARIERLESLL